MAGTRGTPKRRTPSAGASARPGRARLAPEARERLILDEAIRYFSDVGFGGQTRELSRRLGITQPLLYRYFPKTRAITRTRRVRRHV